MSDEVTSDQAQHDVCGCNIVGINLLTQSDVEAKLFL